MLSMPMNTFVVFIMSTSLDFQLIKPIKGFWDVVFVFLGEFSFLPLKYS